MDGCTFFFHHQEKLFLFNSGGQVEIDKVDAAGACMTNGDGAMVQCSQEYIGALLYLERTPSVSST
jgi:hypothetical protein